MSDTISIGGIRSMDGTPNNSLQDKRDYYGEVLQSNNTKKHSLVITLPASYN